MAEMLTYAPDLRSITGGQGEYTMEFAALRGGARPPRAEGRRSDAARRRPSGLAPVRYGLGVARRWLREDGCIRTDQRSVVLRRLRTHAAARRARRALPRDGGSAATCASCARRAPTTRAGSARAEGHQSARAARTPASAALADRRASAAAAPRRREDEPAARARRPRTEPPIRSREPRAGARAAAPTRAAPRREPRRASRATSTPCPRTPSSRSVRALELFNASRAPAHGRRRRPLARALRSWPCAR